MAPRRKSRKQRALTSKHEPSFTDCVSTNAGGLPLTQRISKPTTTKLAKPHRDSSCHVITPYPIPNREEIKIQNSGESVDFNALAESFRTNCTEVLAAIDDISADICYYDRRSLDAEFRSANILEVCREDAKSCKSCDVCRSRRRMRPGVADLEDLQRFVTRLLSMWFQNHFHKRFRNGPEPNEETHRETPTPIHECFHVFQPPSWDGWEQSIKLFERKGSEGFKFPIREEDRVPLGCPATLAYQDGKVIHQFIDRVLGHSQDLHEHYGISQHFTTFLDVDDESCGVCEFTAAFFLPALVGPYFVLRQHRREELALNVIDTLGDSSADGWGGVLVEHISTPIIPDFPELKASTPQLPKRGETKKKSKIIIQPNLPRYEPILLPTLLANPGARFVPRLATDGIDKEKHPYSYFLSLSLEERKVYLKEKVNRTRSNMGYAPIQPHEDTGGGDWKCGWFSLDEIGVKGSGCSSLNAKFGSVFNGFTKEKELNGLKLRADGRDRVGTSVAELRDTEDDTAAVEQAIISLRKLSTDDQSDLERMRKMKAGAVGETSTTTIDASNDTVAESAMVQLDADNAVNKSGRSQEAKPNVHADKSESRKKKRERKRAATSAANYSAPKHGV